MIEIWAPRWHDKKVLIAKHKVHGGENKIRFTKTKQYDGKIFRVDGERLSSYPIESNGKIQCYAVPLEVVVGEPSDENQLEFL